MAKFWIPWADIPGHIVVSDPEYVGCIPIRQEIELLPTDQPYVDHEFNEHGSSLVRFFVGMGSGIDNTLGEDYKPQARDQLLVRSKQGGWYTASVVVKDKLPYVLCDSTAIPLVFDAKRERWVVRELV